MGILTSLLTAQTLVGVLLAVALWVSGKILDKLLDRAFDRKIVSPAVNYAKCRWRSFWTHFDPIDGSFQITYGIHSELDHEAVKSRLERALQTIEESTGRRITYSDPTWRDGRGEFTAQHVESSSDFEVSLRLVRSNDDLMQNPDATLSEQIIEEVNVNVDFQFAYPKLDSELPNLGVFMKKIQESLDTEFHGTAGPAKIVLHPLESDLSLDEWIGRENLEPTLRLTGKDSKTAKTQVEFFDDHVELYPPYYDVDSEVIRYVRLLVKHYYLLNSDQNNILLSSFGSKE